MSNGSNGVDVGNKTRYKELSDMDKVDILASIEVVGYEAVVESMKRVYGICDRSARGWIKRIREELSRNNEESMTVEKKNKKKPIVGKKKAKELGLVVKGVSSYVDSEGNIKGQWIKENVDEKARLEALQHAFMNFVCDSVEPREEIKTGFSKGIEESSAFKNTMVKYPIADAHIGLLTKSNEVGVDWDLETAKKAYKKTVKRIMESSPKSQVGLILELGDMFHVADSTGKTRAHGHQLTVDGNLEEIFEAAIYIVTTMIDMALEKHNTVIFRKTIGNHDGDTSVALGVFLKKYYENNPRVVIESGSDLFWWYKFGDTLHFSTHGHTVKQKDLPEIVAHDCKEVWSDCKYVYIDTGHIHHQTIVETRTCICESHNSLVPGDNYNYGNGYRSGRLLKAIVYTKNSGEIGRSIVRVEV